MRPQTCYRQLQPEDRMTIPSMKQEGSSVRAIARTPGRSAGTNSRGLTRNACAQSG
jgi:IS30 family transposase